MHVAIVDVSLSSFILLVGDKVQVSLLKPVKQTFIVISLPSFPSLSLCQIRSA